MVGGECGAEELTVTSQALLVWRLTTFPSDCTLSQRPAVHHVCHYVTARLHLAEPRFSSKANSMVQTDSKQGPTSPFIDATKPPVSVLYAMHVHVCYNITLLYRGQSPRGSGPDRSLHVKYKGLCAVQNVTQRPRFLFAPVLQYLLMMACQSSASEARISSDERIPSQLSLLVIYPQDH